MTTPDRPYRGGLLPTVEGGEPASPVMVYGGGSAVGPVGKAMEPGSGPVVSGSGGMGMGGGGMFAVAPEANAATIQDRAPPRRSVMTCIPCCTTSSAAAPVVLSTSRRSRRALRRWRCRRAAPAQHGMEALMDLIRDLVATKSWQENGGNGVISAQGNLLCVSQSFQTQCEVKAFLAKLRAKRRAVPNVVVDLQWLWLDGGQYGQASRRREAIQRRADPTGRRCQGPRSSRPQGPRLPRADRLCQRATGPPGLGRPPLDHRQRGSRGRRRHRL